MPEDQPKSQEIKIALLQNDISNILEKVDDINKKLDTNFVSQIEHNSDMKVLRQSVSSEIALVKKDIEMPVKVMYATVLAVLGLIGNKILELVL